MEEKKPRYGLYLDEEYYGVIDLENVMESIRVQLLENVFNGDTCDINIKRIDMTDTEFEAMPEE